MIIITYKFCDYYHRKRNVEMRLCADIMIDIKSEKEYVILRFENPNEFSMGYNMAFKKNIENIFHIHSGKRIIFSMNQITRIDSYGIGTIVFLTKQLSKKNLFIIYTGLREDVLKTLKVVQLDKVLNIVDSVEEAIESL